MRIAPFFFALAAAATLRAEVVINEIMYHPVTPGAEFVELHNRSTTTAFDLAGFRLDGAGFEFASGTWIAPGGFLVLAADRHAFASAYGITPLVTGEFSASLDNAGETLSLLGPAPVGDGESLVDLVHYEPTAPWPEAARLSPWRRP